MVILNTTQVFYEFSVHISYCLEDKYYITDQGTICFGTVIIANVIDLLNKLYRVSPNYLYSRKHLWGQKKYLYFGWH